MKTFTLIFIIVFVFCSCNKTNILRENNIIVYKNFLVSDKIPYDLSNSFEMIVLDTINAGLFSKENNYKQLEPKIASFLISEYLRSSTEFYKITSGVDAKYMIRDSSKVKYVAYSFGKMNIHDKIIGYLVLLKQDHISSMEDNYFNVVLYNVMDNKIQSIVNLFEGTSKPYGYLTEYNKGLFSTLNSFYSPADMSYDVDWLNIRSWYELKLKLGLESYQKYTIFYTNYYIDEIGFVRFTFITGYGPPEIVEKEKKRISKL